MTRETPMFYGSDCWTRTNDPVVNSHLSAHGFTLLIQALWPHFGGHRASQNAQESQGRTQRVSQIRPMGCVLRQMVDACDRVLGIEVGAASAGKQRTA